MVTNLPQRVAENIDRFTGRSWLLGRICDWLDKPTERFFILTGEPGSGKSMVAAWLAGHGPSPMDPEAAQRLQRIRESVKAIHFCVAASGNTDPKIIAENLSRQLLASIPPFTTALLRSLEDRLRIEATLQTGPVGENALITNVNIGEINLAGSGEEIYNLRVRQPLNYLYETSFAETILLIVDALDEGRTFSGSPTIVQLLAKSLDLPPKVRILLTTREDRAVLKDFTEIESVDLIKNAPPDTRDVYNYAHSRLSGLTDADRATLAERIMQASDGNFLYAYLVLNDPQMHTRMPVKLSGIYQEFISRELGRDETRWQQEYRPVLGVVAVSQGEGLTTERVEYFTHRSAGDILRVCKQYLEGDLPEGPFRPFHRSFSEFLLYDQKNVDYHIDPAQMHALITASYCPMPGCEGAWGVWDEYAMQNIVTHLAGAAERRSLEERHRFTESLCILVTNDAFQDLFLQQTGRDLLALRANLERALATASLDTDPRGLSLVVKTAGALLDYRRKHLQPPALFDTARRGELSNALRKLPLFHIEGTWQEAILLLLAWLAVPSNPASARAVRDHLVGWELGSPIPIVMSGEWPLPLLAERLSAALEQRAPDLPPLSDTRPTEEVIVDIINRMAGEKFNEGLVDEFMGNANLELQSSEMLIEMTGQIPGQLPDDAPVFLSQMDGPVLVAFVRDDPENGTKYLHRYLDIHAANNYVYYRNLSLWGLLEHVLSYPDQNWTQEIVVRMATIAMTGERLVFQNALPYAVLAWQASRANGDAVKRFDDQSRATMQVASQTRQDGKNPYAMIHRQLAALAEAATILPGKDQVVKEYMEAIENLGRGLAGYYASAWLTVADTYRICQSYQPEKIGLTLNRAIQAAKNINNEVFCLRTTARVNTFIIRPWEAASANLRVDKLIDKFCDDPLDPAFSPIHIFGDSFTERSARTLSSLEGIITLEGFANIFQQPLADFLRLNPSWNPGHAHVHVPDPKFPPLLAVHFAARALIAPELSPSERVKSIQRLVPIAAAMPTALDQVLGRLVLAAAPLSSYSPVLDELTTYVSTPNLEIIQGLS